MQCQICNKSGHDASRCYHRYNTSLFAPQYTPQYTPKRHQSSSIVPAPKQYLVSSPMPPQVPQQYLTSWQSPPVPYQGIYPPQQQVFLVFSAFNACTYDLIANTTAPSTSYSWYVDSGATHHVTSDPQHLMEAAFVPGNEHVYVGNGQGLPIISKGFTVFASPFNTATKLSLNNLLLVPTITKSLVSVSKFA